MTPLGTQLIPAAELIGLAAAGFGVPYPGDLVPPQSGPGQAPEAAMSIARPALDGPRALEADHR